MPSCFLRRIGTLGTLLLAACGGGTEPAPPPPTTRELKLFLDTGTDLVSGARAPTPPRVTARVVGTDAIATDFTGTVTVTAADTNLRFAGSTSVQAVAGVATFTDLVPIGPAGSYTLTFTGTGVLPATPLIALTQPALVADARRVAAGDRHSCAIRSGSVAWCWGRNAEGQLGIGSTTEQLLPQIVPGGLVLSAIYAGASHTCGLTSAGLAYCWGSNAAGRLGDGTVTPRTVPTLVNTTLRFRSLALGAAHTCGLVADGSAYCWGSNADGQLGLPQTITERLVPTRVSGTQLFTRLGASIAATCGVGGGSVFCWGSNRFEPNGGVLGQGTTADARVFTPTPVAGGGAYVDIAMYDRSACALGPTGAASCWGANTDGQVGDSTVIDRGSPTPVQTIQRFLRIDGGPGIHACAVRADFTAWCWGRNGVGQLGDGTTTSRGVPRVVSTTLRFAELAIGDGHTCGRTTDNTTFACWGTNEQGQHGNGTRIASSTPVTVVFP